MADRKWFVGTGGWFQDDGVALGAARADHTLITCHADANTKGAYAEFFARTPYKSLGMYITMPVGGTNFTTYLMDIAVGQAGSEQIVIADLTFQCFRGSACPAHVWIPLEIPAGSRVSIRGASNAVTNAARMTMCMLRANGKEHGYKTCTTYGADSTDSAGTRVIPGSGAWGTWTALSARTTNRTDAVVIARQINNADWTHASGEINKFEIGYGGAGSEKTVGYMSGGTSKADGGKYPPFTAPLPLSIPRGRRLVIRGASNMSNAVSYADYIAYCLKR